MTILQQAIRIHNSRRSDHVFRSFVRESKPTIAPTSVGPGPKDWWVCLRIILDRSGSSLHLLQRQSEVIQGSL